MPWEARSDRTSKNPTVPEHPEIFEEMRRVRDVFGDEPWENYLSEKKYHDGEHVLQFFRSKDLTTLIKEFFFVDWNGLMIVKKS